MLVWRWTYASASLTMHQAHQRVNVAHDIGYWHLQDVQLPPINVRYQG
jgi:hypothetical protein